MPILLIPSILRAHTDGQERLEVDAATVDEAVAALRARFPQAGERLAQAIARRYVMVSVGGVDVRDRAAGATPLAPTDEVHLLWAVAGG